MNMISVKFLLRILTSFLVLFTLGGVFSPEEMMKSFGMRYTKEAAVIVPFALMGQLFLIILTLQIINWIKDLSKVKMTYSFITFMPVCLNVYQAVTGIVPLTTAFYFEQAIWLTFVILFYVAKK